MGPATLGARVGCLVYCQRGNRRGDCRPASLPSSPGTWSVWTTAADGGFGGRAGGRGWGREGRKNGPYDAGHIDGNDAEQPGEEGGRENISATRSGLPSSFKNASFKRRFPDSLSSCL